MYGPMACQTETFACLATRILYEGRGKFENGIARTYLQLPLRQWGAGNVYLLVLSS